MAGDQRRCASPPSCARPDWSPRWIPTLGLIGAPLLLTSSMATLFGAWEQVSATAMLLVLPIATWEFSVGIYMTVKGFRTSQVTASAWLSSPVAPAATGAGLIR